MTTTAKIEVKNQNLLTALKEFLKSILLLEDISAILVPRHLPMKNVVMPVLISDPEQLDGTDPLAPSFPLNAARIVSRLSRKPMGGKVAVVLRPCEIRAFVELVKLKQGRVDEIIIMGLDCLGAFSNRDYSRFVGEDINESTRKFYTNVLSGKNGDIDGIELTKACKSCENPVPINADILIGLYGIDAEKELLIKAQTSSGEDILKTLDLPAMEEPSNRKGVIDSLISDRKKFRNDMFAETREATDSIVKMTKYFANCVNCYNCRVACPVCYCKECVFVTDVFNHDPSQYLLWANRKGVVKLPTDTVFFHITRLAHMSTACVGCGQCSNACPNDIPVMELFRSVSQKTQKAFDYTPGQSIDDKPPMSVFKEEEFEEVVGIS